MSDNPVNLYDVTLTSAPPELVAVLARYRADVVTAASDLLNDIANQMRLEYRDGKWPIEYINGWEDAAARLEVRAEALRQAVDERG